MSHYHLACTECHESHDADVYTLACRKCSAPLEVAYSDKDVGLSPLHDPDKALTLGEGNTPVIELPRIARSLGVGAIFAKLEYANPTGSFKDRGTAVMIGVMREHGVTELVEDSSGNAGASASAYCARAGITGHIFAPATAPAAKLAQIRVYGATLHAIPGPREAATEAAEAFQKEHGFPYASHNLSPYFIEGTKLFAIEAAMQLGESLPVHVVMPVGNGSLFIGSYKGFNELVQAEQLKAVPKLHAVQSMAAMGVVAAHRGEQWTPSGKKTIAGGISSVAPPRKNEMVRVLKNSGGSGVAVEDEDIVHWQRELAEQEGVYAEPTSAAAFAGIVALVQQGVLDSKSAVLVPITGSGLKDEPPAAL